MMIDNCIDPEINERINSLFNTYIKIVSPLIIQLEVMDGEFPTEILNEIRATMTHFAKVNLSDNETVIYDNLTKAERHIKRAILDGFKYSCLSFDDEYKNFEEKYKNVDLSIVDNGTFIVELSKLRKKATASLINAKSYESETDADEDALYTKYENAYNDYFDLNDYIDKSLKNLEIAKHKSTKDLLIGKIGLWVGIGGLAVGIIGVIINFL